MSNLKLKLKKIDPVKAGIVHGALLGLFGLVIAGFAMLFGSIFGAASGEMGVFGAVLGGGIFAVIFIPIFYFIVGFIAGLIGTMLLNFVLKKTDGMIIDFEKIGETQDITMIGKE
ncbi:hypothetical protein [Tenacibaculum agarivorans]|uniref:hypothetical protein n=1 Tax=Tenacibaculum agarivorans TaxID=1908389 RepID=UPI00094BAAF5|nr:hypothetical protein [Tenacibaculum agarivorans]